jgi:hypothetical protein
LLEMLTQSNLSLLCEGTHTSSKHQHVQGHTEQRRKQNKACLENTFHDHKSLLTTCVTKTWPLSLSLYIYIYNLFSLYVLIFYLLIYLFLCVCKCTLVKPCQTLYKKKHPSQIKWGSKKQQKRTNITKS